MKNGVKDGALALGSRLWSDFRAFSPGQKAVTVAAALALVIGGYLLLTWKSSPTYAPLYTNLAPADASSIVDKLNTEGVPYKLGAAGTEILVPQNKVYSARIAMSAAGLPNSSQTGYSLLDKEGVTTSQFQQQVDYQRAIEGELAKTIQAIQGVNAATVHLAIPQQNVFNDGSQKPTAAVLVTTAAGTNLTSQQVQSIVYLVSSSVPQMSANDVTVTDSQGNVLAAPGSGLTTAAGASTQSQLTRDYNNQQATQLQAMIDRAIGPGNAVVTVNSTLDFNKTSTTTNSYVANKLAPPLSQSKTVEKYKGTGANAGGTVGSATNTDTTGSGVVGSGAGKYSKTTDTVNNAVGTQTQTTENAPGQVKQLSIAVLLNKSAKNVNVAQISQLVKNGVGFNASRGDTLAVQAMPFDNSATAAANKAAAAAKKAADAKAAHDSMMSMIKQGGLVVLVIALVVGTWLAGRKRRKSPEEPNDDVLGLDDLDQPTPRGSAEPTQSLASPFASDINDASTSRRNLAAVADNRPADVARVLSGWLNTKEV